MEIVSAAPRNHVYDAARRVTKLRFISRRHHLKFQNRILIELRRRAAIEIVAIGHAVDEINCVSTTLTQDRCSIVSRGIILPV